MTIRHNVRDHLLRINNTCSEDRTPCIMNPRLYLLYIVYTDLIKLCKRKHFEQDYVIEIY